MENGSWLIFGPVAWIYAIAGFFTAIVKTPYLWVKEAEKYYEKGLERERQMEEVR